MNRYVVLMVVGLVAVVGCNKKRSTSFRSQTGSAHGADSQSPGGAAGANLSDGSLVWQRDAALRNSLMAALELPSNELCKELDRYDCVDQVFRTVLGGHDAIDKGQYEGLTSPSSLTPVALERVVLRACMNRVALDAKLGEQGVVFKHFSLNSDKPTVAQFDHLTVELYRRFLARDPVDGEKSVLRELIKSESNAQDIAVLACMIVGTSAEFNFL